MSEVELVLDRIASPADLKGLSEKELEQLAGKLVEEYHCSDETMLQKVIRRPVPWHGHPAHA